jgi:hypothetical protein
MIPNPRFIQGVFPFEGRGLETPAPLGDGASYLVPGDKRAQLVYLRAGNSSGELVYLLLLKDGKPMRYFPVGSKAALHVPLAVVEDLFPENKLELKVGAPKGAVGVIVLDLGFLEID